MAKTLWGGNQPLGGQALAVHGSSAALVRLSPSRAEAAGVNAGAGIYSFAKAGNEILSSYPFFYSSDNGALFASQAVDLASSSNYLRIATDGTNWVTAAVLAGLLNIYKSTNRANWTDATNAAAKAFFNTWNHFDDLAYGDSKWVVSGISSIYGAVIAYSTDLLNWTQVALPSSISRGGNIAYGNGYFIVTGTTSSPGHTARAASSNLSSWSAVNLPFNTDSNIPVVGYSSVNARWVVLAALAGSAKVAYSDDNGSTYSVGTATGFAGDFYDWNRIVALPSGGFMGTGRRNLGSNGQAGYSADGTSFTAIDVSAFPSLYGLVAL